MATLWVALDDDDAAAAAEIVQTFGRMVVGYGMSDKDAGMSIGPMDDDEYEDCVTFTPSDTEEA